MKKSELNLEILKNSLKTLNECFKDFNEQKDEKLKEYIKDSCIQRFEYTYETAKKIMNKFLKHEYDLTEKDLTINNIFREMFGLNLIKNFENWVEYREKRNYTSHEYSKKHAELILPIIGRFIEDTEYLIEKLYGVLSDD